MKKNIKTSIFFLLALAVIYLLPKIINLPLPFEGTQILAIFIAAILLWLTVGIDWTSIFILLVIPTVIPSIIIA